MKRKPEFRTNFEQVSDYNKANGKRPVSDLYDDNVITQLELIKEEVDELLEAVGEGYLPNIRKELADVLVVSYGLGYLLSFDCDADMAAVNDNNMSKLITSKVVKELTHQYYHGHGIDVDFMDVAPGVCVVLSGKDQTVDGKFYPKGKRLKPAGYMPLELS